MAKLKNVHPGEVLLEEFLVPMNLSQNRLAIDISVDASRINEIILGKRCVTADTALRLGRARQGESRRRGKRGGRPCGADLLVLRGP